MVLGVLCSLVASVAFVFLINALLRPKIIISPQIAKTARDEPDLGATSLRFKIVNRRRRPALDVHITAYLDRPRKVPVNGGSESRTLHMMKVLDLNSRRLHVLPRRRPRDVEARHALRVRFNVDLETLWEDDQSYSVVVRVFARDGWSGAVKEFERVYSLKTCIKSGTFEHGDGFEIV